MRARVLTILGTRPEAIKLAPVILQLGMLRHRVRSRVCVTAQHRHLVDEVLDLFDIRADHDLRVMEEDQSPAQVMARTLQRLEPVLALEQPDWVLVEGDTTTVAAASLAAFYAGCQIGHVEAGLRSFDLRQPFPEEAHRRIATTLANLHFAPTVMAARNLMREGVATGRIVTTGNPVVDALRRVAQMPPDGHPEPLAGLPANRRILLVTAHRRESFGEPLRRICEGLLRIVRARSDVHVVLPVHPNPNVREPVSRLLGGTAGISLVPPMGYASLVRLLGRCYLVLTDSGGLQEEAPSLGKPVLVLRDTTERWEAVTAGVAMLVGFDPERIASSVTRLLDEPGAYRRMCEGPGLFGDGHAAERIVTTLLGRTATAVQPASGPWPGQRPTCFDLPISPEARSLWLAR